VNSDQLQVLHAIIETGSFNAAAKKLNKVPSAISYSMKVLEQDLGLVLFDRDVYRPKLTPHGEAIYRRAKLVLGELDALADLSRQLRVGQEPIIRLDLSPICPTEIITPVLKTISQEFPQTQLKISMEIFGGEQWILQDEADLSLTDQMKPHPQLESRHLLSIPMIAVASSDHPLGQGSRKPEKEILRNHFQVVVRSQSSHMETKSFGILSENITWRVNDFPTKRQLLLDGLGWGHLPATMVARDLEAGTLVELDIAYLPKNIARLSLVRQRTETHGPVATRFWDLLSDAATAFQTSLNPKA